MQQGQGLQHQRRGQLVDARSTDALSLGDERGLPGLTMTAGEAVRRHAADDGTTPHEDATPVLGEQEPFRLQGSQGLAHGHPGDPVAGHQLSLGRDPVTRLPHPGIDLSAQVVGDLLEHGTVRELVDGRADLVDRAQPMRLTRCAAHELLHTSVVPTH